VKHSHFDEDRHGIDDSNEDVEDNFKK